MPKEDLYTKLAISIVKQQESVVGPLAWVEADKVSGLTVEGDDVVVESDGKKVVGMLVEQYESLFGMASVEVCKDAVRDLVTDANRGDVPDILL